MVTASALSGVSSLAIADTSKPNILIPFGDDIGEYNISAYNMDQMGYRTPDIDSLAKEGALFTDWYGQQSCTAGRAPFITGQSPIRTGLTKVGLPRAPEGITKEDPTLADLLKPHGYVTGQFGKNHLGDRNDMLPSNHGFDEWFANLYHLNAEEEPENENENEHYPKDPAFKTKFGPRGVLHCRTSEEFDSTEEPRFGQLGNQACEDTGPFTVKRMETFDDEVTAQAIDFMERANEDDKPFLIWWNTTRMHVYTHLKEESAGKTGYGIFADGMVEHDGHVGLMLAKLKELGLDENTIVMYSSDNGAEAFGWPDGGTTKHRGEKNTQWEGGYPVPTLIRWPGTIEPGTIINDIAAHEDILPTVMAAVGDTTVKEDLLVVKQVGDMTYKVHLDGYNMMPFLKGDVEKSPRKEIIYWTDDGSVAALWYNDWKLTFLRQNSTGFRVWERPFEELRWPMLTNLRMDPFERALDESAGHSEWATNRLFALAPASAYVAGWLQSFKELPPRMKPGSFSLDRVMEAASNSVGGCN
ncbi:arylsulfatase [Sulfitobacter sp. SK012]|nr:arylsulfatase [Sulfitobacter sp. SK012]